MKKIYVSPMTECYSAEMGQMVCASVTVNGIVGVNGSYNAEQPNGGEDMPGFGGYVGGGEDDGPESTAKELDLWGDIEW